MEKFTMRPMPDNIWSDADKQQCVENFLKVKTLNDYKKFCETNEMRLFAQATSFYPVEWSKLDHPINVDGWKFSKIAEVKSLDIKSLCNYVMQECKDVVAGEAAGTYSEDRQNQRSNYVQEQSVIASNGLNRRPHILKVDNENLKEVYDWFKLFEFESYYSQIRYAPPGSVHATHTDSMDGIWETTQWANDNKFLIPQKEPEGVHAIRILIALNDWTPGHIVGFEDQLWTYKAGDAVAFEWANTKHYTANVSWTPRVVLRVTGTTRDPNHWIFSSINTGKFNEI